MPFGDQEEMETHEALTRLTARRDFIKKAASGTILTAIGGASYVLVDDAVSVAMASPRSDGRRRLPPGQRLIKRLKPMGGVPGDPRASRFRLKVHGAVESPFELNLRELVKMGPVERTLDVHCVTGWSLFDGKFKGVRVRDLAKRAGVKKGVRHVIFEAAHGYTANTRFEEAIHPDVLVAYQHDGRRLGRAHGAPVRLINPNLYFWKSPKWLTGIRFVTKDEPGYWEVRGYNNHADPWKEERYA